MTEYITPMCKTGEGSHREQWPLMAISGLILAAVSVCLLVDSLSSMRSFLFALPLLIPLAFFLVAGWLEIQHLLAEARITSDGVTVTRPFSPAQELAWNDFQQVCICLYNKGIGEIGGHGHPQLVFVLPGAKKNLFDRWKTHSAFNTASSSPSTMTRPFTRPFPHFVPWKSPTCATPHPTSKEKEK